MNKLSKVALASMLAMTALVGVGCSDSSTKETAATTTEKKEDPKKVQNAVFAAALIAESQLADSFEERKGLDGDKEVAYLVPKKETDKALEFLSSTYWDKAIAKKEYESLLADAATLEKANKAFEAKVNADNAKAKTEEEKKMFEPEKAVGDDAKIGKNVLTGAKLEDTKVEEKDGKFVIEYKGLKYSLTKEGSSYKVVGKEGTLAN